MKGPPGAPAKYVVAPQIVGSDYHLEITVPEYQTIVTAIEALIHCVDVEEKFNAIIENYAEFETVVFRASLGSLIADRLDAIASQELRTAVARKLSNFLSSVRLYQDSVEHHCKGIVDDDDILKELKVDISREFDGSLSYRIMDGLRNYAQHRALPVHGYWIGSQWSANREINNFEFRPNIHVADLAADPIFRRATITEIESGPEELELKPMIRTYIESLGNLHAKFRSATNGSVYKHHQFILGIKQRGLESNPAFETVGLAAFAVDDKGHKIGPATNLSKTLDDYLRFLQDKNKLLMNFSQRRILY